MAYPFPMGDLLRAVFDGKVDDVRQAISASADLNAQDKQTPSGLTALHVAAGMGRVECLTVLLDAGADVTILNFQGITPLYCAVSKGQVACVKELVRRGAKLDFSSNGGGLAERFDESVAPEAHAQMKGEGHACWADAAFEFETEDPEADEKAKAEIRALLQA